MLRIRNAIPGDALDILRVHREAVLAKSANCYDRTTIENWAARSSPNRIRRLEAEIADPRLTLMIAESGDEILGFSITIRDFGLLRAVYAKRNKVAPIGRILLATAEMIAFRTVPFLECDATLNSAGWFARNGFEPLCRSDRPLQTGRALACVRMRKDRSGRMAK